MTTKTIDENILRRCVQLAEEGLLAGEDAFGSVLVSATGQVLKEDHNRTNSARPGETKPDATYHPEIELARWAQEHLGPEERANSTVYTSGEHCPMCSAAHAWCGMGRIVYVSSSAQYSSWLKEFGVTRVIVSPLSIQEVAPNIEVVGPFPELAEEVRALHRRKWLGNVA